MRQASESQRSCRRAAVHQHDSRALRLCAAEKSSWLGLAKSSTGSGQWRPARCKLVEEEEGCLLNIYVDVSRRRAVRNAMSMSGADPGVYLAGHYLIPIYLHVFAEPCRHPACPPLPVREEKLHRDIRGSVREHSVAIPRLNSLTA